MTRVGHPIQLHSGTMFYPLDPRHEEILIEDIAHALSYLCRFGGHAKRFYSVAQHCLEVSRNVPRDLALEGLLHDATEAYIGDMCRPLKRSMAAYCEVEAALERAIAEKFKLRYPWPPDVMFADDSMLMTEKRDVLAVDVPWSVGVLPYDYDLCFLSPPEARRQFLARFAELAR